jgi:hypothetical protein
MLTDIHSNTAKFVKISEAKSHGRSFLKHSVLPRDNMIVFDWACSHYFQLARWSEEGVNPVCQLKDNAVITV